MACLAQAEMWEELPWAFEPGRPESPVSDLPSPGLMTSPGKSVGLEGALLSLPVSLTAISPRSIQTPLPKINLRLKARRWFATYFLSKLGELKSTASCLLSYHAH